MATQSVHIDLSQPGVTAGNTAWSGTLLATPVNDHGRPAIHADGTALVVPEPVSIDVTSGEATIVIEASVLGSWCWEFKAADGNPAFPARYVHIGAAGGTVEFAELPQVNLSSLSPTATPEAAWVLALAALQAQVDALGTGAGTGTVASVNGVDPVDGDVTLTKTDVGLGSVDNTSDAAKPVSTAQAAAIAAAINSLVSSAPGTLDTLAEIATALGSDPNFATTITNLLAARVRTDTAAQGLTSTQQSNARTNILAMGKATGVTERFLGFLTEQPASPATGDWWILVTA